MALLGFLVACQAGPPPPDPGRTGSATEPPETSAVSALAATPAPPSGPAGTATAPSQADPPTLWEEGDCFTILAGFRAAAAGPAAADPPPPIAVLLREWDGRVWLAADRLRLDADLPLAVHQGGGDGSGIAAPCLLVVAAPGEPPNLERRVSDPERVASAYVTGVIREANPAYEAARIRARQAERRLGGRGDIATVRTGDPLVDLIGTAIGGLLGTVDALDAEREFEDAVAALKDTPPRRERPVYQPYHYERVTIRASKRAAVPVALIDRERDRVWSTRVPSSEEREFHLANGRHAKDRDADASDGDPERQLQLWERLAPEVRLSALVDGLLAAAPAARPAGGLAMVLARLDAGAVRAAGESATAAPMPVQQVRRPIGSAPVAARPPADPRLRSVVRVAAPAGAGSGFYVAPEFVLTNDHVTDGARVVDVTLPDGTTVPGLVARRDRRRDLALIKVPKPGPSLTLEAGAALEPGSPVEAVGHAQDPDLSLSRGVVGAVRHVPSPGAGGLRDVLVVETDAALDAGGPLLQGDRVVGVNAWGRAEHGGPNLAVHYREVLDFLAEAGI